MRCAVSGNVGMSSTSYRPKKAAHLTLLLEGAQTAAQNGSVPRLRENLLKLVDTVLNAD